MKTYDNKYLSAWHLPWGMKQWRALLCSVQEVWSDSRQSCVNTFSLRRLKVKSLKLESHERIWKSYPYLPTWVKQFLVAGSDLDILGAAESCRELHGAAWWAAGSCCSWLVGKFRGGYHRQPGLPRFGVCQDVSSNSKIFRASDSPSLSRLCQASKPRHCRKWALLRGVTISFALTECSLWWATLCTSMFRPIAEQWPRKIVASQSWIWKGPFVKSWGCGTWQALVHVLEPSNYRYCGGHLYMIVHS